MHENAPTIPGRSRRHPATVHVRHHDFGGPARLSTSVVHAVSDVTGVDPTDARFCLHDYVDPDSLDRLFAPGPDGTPPSNVRFTFDVWGYRVTVEGDGRILVEPPRGPGDGPR